VAERIKAIDPGTNIVLMSEYSSAALSQVTSQ
jgi:hypothetical protein